MLLEHPAEVLGGHPDEAFGFERGQEVGVRIVSSLQTIGDVAMQERRVAAASYPDHGQGFACDLGESHVACGAAWQRCGQGLGELQGQDVVRDGTWHAGRMAGFGPYETSESGMRFAHDDAAEVCSGRIFEERWKEAHDERAGVKRGKRAKRMGQTCLNPHGHPFRGVPLSLARHMRKGAGPDVVPLTSFEEGPGHQCRVVGHPAFGTSSILISHPTALA